MRVWVSVALVAAMAAVGTLMYVFYKIMGY